MGSAGVRALLCGFIAVGAVLASEDECCDSCSTPANLEIPIGAALGSLMLLFAFAWAYERQQRGLFRWAKGTARLTALRFNNGEEPPTLKDTLEQGKTFHLFCSHIWMSGQDQVHTITRRLETMLPHSSVFLDVDDLKDLKNLEGNVLESQVVLVFLSSQYFNSINCRRELLVAYEHDMPLVLVHEMEKRDFMVALAQLWDECVRHTGTHLTELAVPWASGGKPPDGKGALEKAIGEAEDTLRSLRGAAKAKYFVASLELGGEAKRELTEEDDMVADAHLIDTNGDGRGDTRMIDTTGDGKADAKLIDTTGDGQADTIVLLRSSTQNADPAVATEPSTPNGGSGKSNLFSSKRFGRKSGEKRGSSSRHRSGNGGVGATNARNGAAASLRFMHRGDAVDESDSPLDKAEADIASLDGAPLTVESARELLAKRYELEKAQATELLRFTSPTHGKSKVAQVLGTEAVLNDDDPVTDDHLKHAYVEVEVVREASFKIGEQIAEWLLGGERTVVPWLRNEELQLESIKQIAAVILSCIPKYAHVTPATIYADGEVAHAAGKFAARLSFPQRHTLYYCPHNPGMAELARDFGALFGEHVVFEPFDKTKALAVPSPVRRSLKKGTCTPLPAATSHAGMVAVNAVHGAGRVAAGAVQGAGDLVVSAGKGAGAIASGAAHAALSAAPQSVQHGVSHSVGQITDVGATVGHRLVGGKKNQPKSFLVLLSRKTFDNKDKDRFIEEVAAALEAGYTPMLLHDKRANQAGPENCYAPFREVAKQFQLELGRNLARQLLGVMALPVHSGAHFTVSAIRFAEALGARVAPLSCEQVKKKRNEWRDQKQNSIKIRMESAMKHGSTQYLFQVGARVRHEGRGAGTVIELQDGKTKILFDHGEEHAYLPKSLHKLELVSTEDWGTDADAGREHSMANGDEEDMQQEHVPYIEAAAAAAAAPAESSSSAPNGTDEVSSLRSDASTTPATKSLFSPRSFHVGTPGKARVAPEQGGSKPDNKSLGFSVRGE